MGSVSAGLSLVDFTAHELPTKRWMKLVRPKMRLRVRVPHRDFVSPPVQMCHDPGSDGLSSSIHWPWGEDGRFPRPSFADDEVFEVEVERRFLLSYKCIRRTKPVTIDQVRTGDHCALSLYDGQQPVEVLEDRAEIGEIMFTLRGHVIGQDRSSESKTSCTTYPI